MVTNKQIALVFREAKKDLHIGANASLHKSKYICLAIDGRVNLPIEHRKAALAIIKERLEDKYTLAEWLASKGVSMKIWQMHDCMHIATSGLTPLLRNFQNEIPQGNK